MADLHDMVDVDLRSFDRVYREYEGDRLTMREDLVGTFTGRLQKVADWTPVVLDRGKVVGFMMGCPTDRGPADFTTWEDMTDNGTLNSTFSATGRNTYIVSLSMLASHSSSPARSMLIATHLGLLIRGGTDLAFFESRMPGLRSWAKAQCRKRGINLDELSDEETNILAETYFGLTRTVNGKTGPHDRLLRIYQEAGAKHLKLIPNAYQDHPSMDYGVLTAFTNPLPPWARRNPVIRQVLGRFILLAAKSPMIAKLIF
ncbi:MAG TPA: hypothetical protein VFO77_11490 [Actinoplanes sp.]|nr:hypothetical protein [Actinoplanes sp.]